MDSHSHIIAWFLLFLSLTHAHTHYHHFFSLFLHWLTQVSSSLHFQGLWWRWSARNRKQRRERMGLPRQSPPAPPYSLRRRRQQKLPRHRWRRQSIFLFFSSIFLIQFVLKNRGYRSKSHFFFGGVVVIFCSCSLGVGTKGPHLGTLLRPSLRTRLRTLPARSRLFPVLKLFRYSFIHSLSSIHNCYTYYTFAVMFDGILIMWVLMILMIHLCYLLLC